jgi:tetratricopeptide (TPR) repeat protein
MRLRSPIFAPRSAFGPRIGYLIALLVIFGALPAPASAQTQSSPGICSEASKQAESDPAAKMVVNECALATLPCSFKSAAVGGTPQFQPAINKCTEEALRDAAANAPNTPDGRWIMQYERTKSRSRQTDEDDCTDKNPDVDAMVASCSNVIERRSGSPRFLAEAYILRAEVYIKRGKYAAAIDDASQAIRSDPQFGNGYIARGQAYVYTRDFDHAIADLTVAIKLSREPRILNVAFETRGYVYMAKRRYDLAINDLDQAIAIEPNDAQAIYHRGQAKNLLGQAAEGERDITAARSIDPNVDK